MSSSARQLAAVATLLLCGAAAPATPPDQYGLGTAPTAAQIAQWSIAIKPDGSNLPPGSGSVDQGSDVYGQKCAMCHGTFGEGVAAYPKLAGGVGTLATQKLKTVGSFWPYAPVLYDYINRSMPFYAPHSLTSDQVYGISAYILNLNNIVPDNFVANAKTLAAVKMPNRDGFNFKDPRPLTHDVECMSHCANPKTLVITSDASKSAITPKTTGPVDTMQGAAAP